MLETLIIGGAIAGLIACLFAARRILLWVVAVGWIAHDPLDPVSLFLIVAFAVGFVRALCDRAGTLSEQRASEA